MATEQTRDKNVEVVQEDIRGQGGTIVPVNEVRYTPDVAILDPNSPLAVQIPEGVGADGSRTDLGLASALAEGHVEAKFGTEAAPVPTSADADGGDTDATRSVGETSGGTFTPDHDTIVTPDVYNEPAIVRENNVTRDVADEAPGTSPATSPSTDGEAASPAPAQQQDAAASE